MTGGLSTPAVAPASSSIAQPKPAPVPVRPALAETGIAGPFGLSQDATTGASIIDLLKAGLGAARGLALSTVGMWLGIRRALLPSRVHESTVNVSELPRTPTCERMYDETRLVPQYIRRTEFPVTRRDLLRLAEVHADEGRVLHRLQHVPDRRYSSLHDLISELYVD